MILVTGATGNVGSELVQQLLRTGQSIRVLTRNPGKVSLPETVDIAVGDLSAPKTLRTALTNVDKVFLLRIPGSDGFTQLAKEFGIEKIVFLSSSAIESPTENAIGQNHLRTEELIRESGLKWTFLRPGAFMSNTLHWAASIRMEGVVRAPFGEVGTAPIDPRDIAAVASVALTSSSHDNKIYTLTGPEVLTPLEQVRTLSDVLDREIRFEDVPETMAEETMKKFALPEIVDALFKIIRDHTKEKAVVLNTVDDVTGVPARTFRQWAVNHAQLFR